ncbi:MAG TPA: hypothetical protein VLL52_20425 [Anaerolineae bacterium]|nr:hypothetical protein [Anaerolineae bacterium]
MIESDVINGFAVGFSSGMIDGMVQIDKSQQLLDKLRGLGIDFVHVNEAGERRSPFGLIGLAEAGREWNSGGGDGG